jgi:hypothetical protein
MAEILAVVYAYGVGVWVAAVVVAARRYVNTRTSLSAFLTMTGWAAVATVAVAIASTVPY